MSNATAVWTPGVVQRVANENGWDTKEYSHPTGMNLAYFRDNATVHVTYSKRDAIVAAWLCVQPASGWSSYWVMLDSKVSGKRDIVIRWLAGDFTVASEYALQ